MAEVGDSDEYILMSAFDRIIHVKILSSTHSHLKLDMSSSILAQTKQMSLTGPFRFVIVKMVSFQLEVAFFEVISVEVLFL